MIVTRPLAIVSRRSPARALAAGTHRSAKIAAIVNVFMANLPGNPRLSIRLLDGEASALVGDTLNPAGLDAVSNPRFYNSLVTQSGESFFGRSHERQTSGPPLSRCSRRTAR